MEPCRVGTFKELTVGGVRNIWGGKLTCKQGMLHPLFACKCVLTMAGTSVFSHDFLEWHSVH